MSEVTDRRHGSLPVRRLIDLARAVTSAAWVLRPVWVGLILLGCSSDERVLRDTSLSGRWECDGLLSVKVASEWHARGRAPIAIHELLQFRRPSIGERLVLGSLDLHADGRAVLAMTTGILGEYSRINATWRSTDETVILTFDDSTHPFDGSSAQIVRLTDQILALRADSLPLDEAGESETPAGVPVVFAFVRGDQS